MSVVLLMSGCHTVDDERIPAVPVNINLADAGLWNTYGVSGFGLFRYFIPRAGEPAGFRYTANTATGFGGVLLIGGMDPFSTETNVPLAYDLACPGGERTECPCERTPFDIRGSMWQMRFAL